MTEHSKIRKKTNKQSVSNQTTVNTYMSNNTIFTTENHGSDQKIGNEEVYYNFDKEKFIGNLNGMTKFFVALGSLDSRLDSVNLETKKELHYVHIPRFVRTSENKLKSNLEGRVREGDINFDFNNLNSGDTFVLESKWIKVEQSELIANNIKTEKKFINGIINRNNNIRDKKDNIKIKDKNGKMLLFTHVLFNKNNSIEKINENNTDIKKNFDQYSNNNNNIYNNNVNYVRDSNNDNDNNVKSVASVCVKYMGSLGGIWPTPQVIIFTPQNFF